MKTLNPDEYVNLKICEAETQKFEAFLDRNFPEWREREMFRNKNAGTILRKWRVGIDEVERTAFYRRQYVEISDDFIDIDEAGDAQIHFLKHFICDIEGDLTPVAVWGERSK